MHYVQKLSSIGIFPHCWKIDRLNDLAWHLKLDIIMSCEAQCNWRFVDSGRQFLDLLCPEIAKTRVASNNNNECINREQIGRMAIAVMGHICDVVTEVGQDHTGLAHYSWIKLG